MIAAAPIAMTRTIVSRIEQSCYQHELQYQQEDSGE
jgi:hypothetical protein